LSHRTLGDFLADLFQNGVEAGARTVGVVLDQDEHSFTLTITDDGKGMDEAEVVRAQDPFTTDGVKHPRRKVGLGLPFVIQTVEMTQGEFQISSKQGEGTTVTARFNVRHWDTPPLGDLPAALGLQMALGGDHEAVVVRRLTGPRGTGSYEARRSELLEALGNLDDLGALTLLREYFRSQEKELWEATQ
jgi:hypothetical protein